jgi:hypothetical protein
MVSCSLFHGCARTPPDSQSPVRAAGGAPTPSARAPGLAACGACTTSTRRGSTWGLFACVSPASDSSSLLARAACSERCRRNASLDRHPSHRSLQGLRFSTRVSGLGAKSRRFRQLQPTRPTRATRASGSAFAHSVRGYAEQCPFHPGCAGILRLGPTSARASSPEVCASSRLWSSSVGAVRCARR